jgi:hypothetical protein
MARRSLLSSNAAPELFLGLFRRRRITLGEARETMLDPSYFSPIEDLLVEINGRTDWHLELHPFCQYPIRDDSCVCFTVHDKVFEPARVMHLSISIENFIEDGDKQRLSEAGASRAAREIVSFFERAVGRASSSTAG